MDEWLFTGPLPARRGSPRTPSRLRPRDTGSPPGPAGPLCRPLELALGGQTARGADPGGCRGHSGRIVPPCGVLHSRVQGDTEPSLLWWTAGGAGGFLVRAESRGPPANHTPHRGGHAGAACAGSLRFGVEGEVGKAGICSVLDSTTSRNPAGGLAGRFGARAQSGRWGLPGPGASEGGGRPGAGRGLWAATACDDAAGAQVAPFLPLGGDGQAAVVGGPFDAQGGPRGSHPAA